MTKASPQRTLWLALGAIVAVAATLWTGFVMAGWTIGSVTKDRHTDLPLTVTSLTIDASSVDVVLEHADSGRAEIDTHAKGSLWLPKLTARVDGDHVSVSGGCHMVVFGSCSAKVVVQVPDQMAVNVTTGSGDVRASQIRAPLNVTVRSGDVDLDTLSDDVVAHVTSGDISARALAGTAELRTTSGDISAAALRSPSITAHATSGDVFVDAETAPRELTASATSGDVEVTVPRGASYNAQVDTSSGDHHLGIADDPSATHHISATATSGDADIRYRDN
jgi:DUF4097 and DUF4098 domain-containing protein YvlB